MARRIKIRQDFNFYKQYNHLRKKTISANADRDQQALSRDTFDNGYTKVSIEF